MFNGDWRHVTDKSIRPSKPSKVFKRFPINRDRSLTITNRQFRAYNTFDNEKDILDADIGIWLNVLSCRVIYALSQIYRDKLRILTCVDCTKQTNVLNLFTPNKSVIKCIYNRLEIPCELHYINERTSLLSLICVYKSMPKRFNLD